MTVKVATSFLSSDSDQDLITDFGGVILPAMTDNPNYVNPVPPLATVAASVKAFSDAYGASLTGGPQQTAIKNECRVALVGIGRELGSYVQLNCKGSLSILLSSGFPYQKTERQPIGPLPAPSNAVLALGLHSGELDASVDPVYGAATYNWRVMAVSAPTVVVQELQGTPASATFTGLTPGVVYILQVNAVGTAGASGWTQSAPQMAV